MILKNRFPKNVQKSYTCCLSPSKFWIILAIKGLDKELYDKSQTKLLEYRYCWYNINNSYQHVNKLKQSDVSDL